MAPSSRIAREVRNHPSPSVGDSTTTIVIFETLPGIRPGVLAVITSTLPNTKGVLMGVRRRWLLPALVLVAAAGVGVAMAATMSSSGGTVKAAHNSKYGSLLVSAAGM